MTDGPCFAKWAERELRVPSAAAVLWGQLAGFGVRLLLAFSAVYEQSCWSVTAAVPRSP